MQYLVFRLYGAMASWGDAAVGNVRPSRSHPGRSAIIGLLASALGIRREQQTQLDKLAQAITIAVKEYREGDLLSDYHTAQVPSEDKSRSHRHRKSELSGANHTLNTVLSSREYRCDGVWSVAIAINNSQFYCLEKLSDALRQPKFTLYLGRKSCPLSAPLLPQIIEVDTLREALDHQFPRLLADFEREEYWLRGSEHTVYYWQGGIEQMESDGGIIQSRQVWDDPGHRQKWQFSPRIEHQLILRKER